MQLTLASLSSLVFEELGRDPSRLSKEELVNEAGQAWVNASQWRYLRDRTKEIVTTSGTEDYALGRGIRAVHEQVRRPDSSWCDIPVIDFTAWTREVNQYQARSTYSQRPIATVQWTALEGDDRPTYYLRLFPWTFDERLVVEFHAGWMELDTPSDVADVPEPLHLAFKHWVRHYAKEREWPDENMGLIDRFKMMSVFRDAVSVDGEGQGRIVKRTGGAGERYARKRTRTYGGGWTSEDILRYSSLELE